MSKEGAPETIDLELKNGVYGGDESGKKQEKEVASSYGEYFGFSEKDIADLGANPEYQKLSDGQKSFVFDSLLKATAENVDEVAESKYKESLAGKNFGGKILSNIFKETVMSNVKEKTFDDMRMGGLTKHKDSIDAIISRVNIMDTPIIENEKGELEVQYSSKFSEMLNTGGAGAERAQRAFNQAATSLQNIPPEWESLSATPTQRKAFKKAEELYKAERNNCINIYKQVNKEKNAVDFIEKLAEVENNIDLNRLMNAHPDNERLLNNLNKTESEKALSTVGSMAKDLITKDNKAYYAGAGFAARTFGKYMDWLNYGSVGIISGAIGAIRGIGKARKSLRENEANMRRGGKNKLKLREDYGSVKKLLSNHMEVNMTDISKDRKDTKVGGKGYIEKINDIKNKITEANDKGEWENVARYKVMLDNRINYAIERAKDGKVNFGNKENRLANKFAFAEAIKNGELTSIASDPKQIEKFKAQMIARMDAVYGKQDEKERGDRVKFITKYATKNALIGAAFGVAGYAARHIYEVISADDVVQDIPNEEIAPRVPDEKIIDIPKPDKGEISELAYIKKGEGIEHTLRRQIEHDPSLAKSLGWDGKTSLRNFSGSAAHRLAITEGYVDQATGQEIRVKFTGDKDTFYEIKKGADGSIRIDEGRGTTYMNNEDQSFHADKEYEYVDPGSKKVNAINYPKLEKPVYEDLAGDNHAPKINHNDEIKIQPGKKLVSETPGIEDIHRGQPQPARAVITGGHNEQTQPVRAVYDTNKPGYKTLVDGSPEAREMRKNGFNWQEQKYNESYGRSLNGVRGANPNGFDLPRSQSGTYLKTVRVNGREIMLDTHSYDANRAFDNRVHDQYDRLVGEIFGKRSNISGDIILDREVSGMLMKNNAIDDINFEIGDNMDEKTRDYFEMVQEIHQTSGQEPKPGEPTAIYLKEAMQKMKNDGRNIKKFVTELLKNERAEDAEMGITSTSPTKEYEVDDVYK